MKEKHSIKQPKKKAKVSRPSRGRANLRLLARVTDAEIRLGGGLELEVAATSDPQERPYYAGGWFSIDVGGANVADGGFVDWTQRLLSDRKERCLISGVGIERIASLTA